MFQETVVEEVKKNILFSVILSFPENRTVYEMWKNIVQPDKPQVTTSACPLHAEYLGTQTRSDIT
jgi:hypothetical protein